MKKVRIFTRWKAPPKSGRIGLFPPDARRPLPFVQAVSPIYSRKYTFSAKIDNNRRIYLFFIVQIWTDMQYKMDMPSTHVSSRTAARNTIDSSEKRSLAREPVYSAECSCDRRFISPEKRDILHRQALHGGNIRSFSSARRVFL